jgi:hypothetical protein
VIGKDRECFHSRFFAFFILFIFYFYFFNIPVSNSLEK